MVLCYICLFQDSYTLSALKSLSLSFRSFTLSGSECAFYFSLYYQLNSNPKTISKVKTRKMVTFFIVLRADVVTYTIFIKGKNKVVKPSITA